MKGDINMTIDDRIKFDEVYVSEEHESTTYYFTMEKSLLDEFRPDEYPEAESGELKIEFPTNNIEASVAHVEISPTKYDPKEESYSDYDWVAIELSYEDIETLMFMAENN